MVREGASRRPSPFANGLHHHKPVFAVFTHYLGNSPSLCVIEHKRLEAISALQ